MELSRFDSVSEFYLSDRFISTDKYLEHANKCSSCQYVKRDFFYSGGRWRDTEYQRALKARSATEANLLLFGHSDIKTSIYNSFPFMLSGYRNMWGTNVIPFGDILHSLPLGLTNSTNETAFHGIFGNNKHFLIASSESNFSKTFSYSIYANFAISTMPRVRLKLANFLETVGVKLATMDVSEVGRIRYLKELRENNLVVCPVGNGPDTHRVWETLYMGGTPVVLSSKFTNHLFSNLPVIILNNWTQLSDSSQMEERWHDLNKKMYDYKELDKNYWINLFCPQNLNNN